jgi:DNA-binding LacI/PurR family transcriptional regulator
MRPTIRDVARNLNLSITTVSRAPDGYDDVAEETRHPVIETARKMGYTPNRAARQLRRQKAETVGCILPASAQHFAESFLRNSSLVWAINLLHVIMTCWYPPSPVRRMDARCIDAGRRADLGLLHQVSLCKLPAGEIYTIQVNPNWFTVVTASAVDFQEKSD